MSEEKPTPLKVEVLEKIAALITVAFGLVAALAWNEAIKAIFKEIFGSAEAVTPMLIYAIAVTIIAVILTIIVARMASKAKAKA
jgi:uncharacterized membrane protein YidH (DUF202 family)